jgi:hypothetical protein
MEPLTRTEPKQSLPATVGKELARGLAIGVGVYAAWVIVHAVLFGVLG